MSNSTKFIRDSIHGNLPLDPFEIEVLDYPQLQRLRRVKQLGFISLIYPGANHSRFEHSIGTMHLASKLADQLELSKDDKDLVRIAGLLHDAGHGPFSHVSEAVLGVNHEEITAFVIEKTSIHDKLSEKFDTKEIIDIINGEGKLGPIISGDLDMDRMDYLIRDSHRELILDIKGVQAAESALTARYLMYPSVYQHHTTRIINAMFRRCLRDLINQDSLDPKDMYKYDDADMISICRHSEGLSREMMEKIDNRNLLKRAKVLPANLFEEPEKIFKIEKEDLLKAEEEISEDFNLNRDYTILNIADKLYHLSEISSIVDALNNARFNSSDLCLFVDSEDVEKVRRLKIENYLDLPETTRKYDTIHTDQVRLM